MKQSESFYENWLFILVFFNLFFRFENLIQIKVESIFNSKNYENQLNYCFFFYVFNTLEFWRHLCEIIFSISAFRKVFREVCNRLRIANGRWIRRMFRHRRLVRLLRRPHLRPRDVGLAPEGCFGDWRRRGCWFGGFRRGSWGRVCERCPCGRGGGCRNDVKPLRSNQPHSPQPSRRKVFILQYWVNERACK